MNKALKLLKEAVVMREGDPPVGKILLIKEKYDQAIEILEPCGICGGSKRVPMPAPKGKGFVMFGEIPCPCQGKPEQKPQSEFVKNIYEKWSPAPKHTKDPRLTLALIDLLDACARLEEAEADSKEWMKKAIQRREEKFKDRLKNDEEIARLQEKLRKALDIAIGYIGQNDCSAIAIQNEIKDILKT